MLELDYATEKWLLNEPFQIAGHKIIDLDIVYVRIQDQNYQGHGEGVIPIVFEWITLEKAREQLEFMKSRMKLGNDIRNLIQELPAGSARNALDCAFWDYRAKSTHQSICELAGLSRIDDMIEVNQTLGIANPEVMAERASKSEHRIIKIKLNNELIIERVKAVRNARPDAELIIDANQSWSIDILKQHAVKLADLDVKMIEQPLNVNNDHELYGFDCPIPIFADESCHISTDVSELKNRYQGVNVKLDKSGGLTEALKIVTAVKREGLGLMVGCMAGTSLSMAPAYIIGTLSQWADLDGPLLLKDDRLYPMTYEHGRISKFHPSLWG